VLNLTEALGWPPLHLALPWAGKRCPILECPALCKTPSNPRPPSFTHIEPHSLQQPRHIHAGVHRQVAGGHGDGGKRDGGEEVGGAVARQQVLGLLALAAPVGALGGPHLPQPRLQPKLLNLLLGITLQQDKRAGGSRSRKKAFYDVGQGGVEVPQDTSSVAQNLHWCC
jgi:hypothetical protein